MMRACWACVTATARGLPPGFLRTAEIGGSQKARRRAQPYAMMDAHERKCMKRHDRNMLHATWQVHVHAACIRQQDNFRGRRVHRHVFGAQKRTEEYSIAPVNKHNHSPRGRDSGKLPVKTCFTLARWEGWSAGRQGGNLKVRLCLLP